MGPNPSNFLSFTSKIVFSENLVIIILDAFSPFFVFKLLFSFVYISALVQFHSCKICIVLQFISKVIHFLSFTCDVIQYHLATELLTFLPAFYEVFFPRRMCEIAAYNRVQSSGWKQAYVWVISFL